MTTADSLPIKVLFVDDEEQIIRLFQLGFGQDYDLLTANSGEEALHLLDEFEIAVMITDHRMPGMTGVELVKETNQRSPDTISIILSAFSDSDILLAAIHEAKVHDYWLKPWKVDEVRQRLDIAIALYRHKIETKRRLKQLDLFRKQYAKERDLDTFIGFEGDLEPVGRLIEQAAPTDLPLLIRGETGTGKEMVTRLLHQKSPQCDGPLINVHCPAIPANMFESQLFGHIKGAFPGATTSEIGYVELADQGILFLDEISELPREVQAKIIRLMETGEFQRVGGTGIRTSKVRIIAASNRNLELAVQENIFRKDLFFRLNAFPIFLPPLRERRRDLLDLATYFAQKANHKRGRALALSAKANKLIQTYTWPGNVREMENVIERAVIVANGPEIEAEDLNLSGSISQGLAPTVQDAPPQLRDEIEDLTKQRIFEALRATNGNKSEAAKLLNMARSTFYEKLHKYGL